MAVGILLVAITAAAPAKSQVEHIDPQTHEVHGVSGTDQTGDGAYRKALIEAVEAAVYAIFIQTATEKARYVLVRDEILARHQEFIRSTRLVDKYVDGDQEVVQLDAVIDRTRLEKALRTAGVFTDLLSIRPPQRPRALVYLADGSANSLSEFAVARVNDFLTRHAVETIDRETLEQLRGQDARLAQAGSAAAQNLALQSQADLWLLVSASVSQTRQFGNHQLFQATVRVEAWEAFGSSFFAAKEYQSRELTFETFEDREKAMRATVEEAVGGALEILSPAIFRVHKEAVENGPRYRIVLQRGSLAAVESLTNEIGSLATVTGIDHAPLAVVWSVRYKGPLENLVETLVRRLGKSPGFEVQAETLREVVLDFKMP